MYCLQCVAAIVDPRLAEHELEGRRGAPRTVGIGGRPRESERACRGERMPRLDRHATVEHIELVCHGATVPVERVRRRGEDGQGAEREGGEHAAHVVEVRRCR